MTGFSKVVVKDDSAVVVTVRSVVTGDRCTDVIVVLCTLVTGIELTTVVGTL